MEHGRLSLRPTQTTHHPPGWPASSPRKGRVSVETRASHACWTGLSRGGGSPSHMVWTTWAWRGSDSWAVGSRRWPELCSSQSALGLGAAACSQLREFVGGWLRFGQPVGGTPARSGPSGRAEGAHPPNKPGGLGLADPGHLFFCGECSLPC